MSKRAKLGFGSASTVIGALGFFLSIIFNWSDIASPWNFLLGFLWGILLGVGTALAVAGLITKKD